MKQMSISGESAEVQGQNVISWKERLFELLHGYKKEDTPVYIQINAAAFIIFEPAGGGRHLFKGGIYYLGFEGSE